MAASIGTQLKGRLTSEIRVSVEACVTKFRLGLGFQFSTQGGALKKRHILYSRYVARMRTLKVYYYLCNNITI